MIGSPGRVSVSGQREVAIKDLLRGSPDLAVRPTAFEGLTAEGHVPLTVSAVTPPSGVCVVFHSTCILSELIILLADASADYAMSQTNRKRGSSDAVVRGADQRRREAQFRGVIATYLKLNGNRLVSKKFIPHR